jgi:SAM-dependent methyltransferase
MITQLLKEKLACPVCAGALEFSVFSVKCASCGSLYEIIDGIPVMLPPAIKKASEKDNAFWDEYWLKVPMHNLTEIESEPDIISAFNHVKPLWDKFGRDCFFEAGCGSGRLLYLMGKTGVPVIGFDNSVAALKFTAKFLSNAGIKNYQLVCGDMRHIPFKENSIGMIYGGGSIEHFDGQQEAINSMQKALIPGAALSLTYPYISISTLTYRQLFGNIPDLPVLKEFYKFMHETVFRKKFMRFGYEKSFTIGKMQRFYGKSGFKDIHSGLFETYLYMTFIKNEKLKNFMRKLSTLKPFWPMVYTTGIK